MLVIIVIILIFCLLLEYVRESVVFFVRFDWVSIFVLWFNKILIVDVWLVVVVRISGV